ncbi:MAG: glycosyltransferase, partial [Acidobacteriota bacterium]
MRILLINQYFFPDRAATSQLLGDLAEELVACGHSVTALAGRGSYAAGREGRLSRREMWKGVRIERVWCTDRGRRRGIDRMADYLSYFFFAGLRVLFGPRHDLVVCLSTPPLVAFLGRVAQLRGSRFVYKVEDLYPDLALAMGTLKPGLVSRLLARLSR